MDLLTAAAVVGLTMAGASHFASIALALRRVGRSGRRLRLPPAEGVSVLRPVWGLEYRIEATLAPSFRIDHPNYEVIFCVAAANDPVVPIVRRLIREHPEIPARLLVGANGEDPNPKLGNLMKAWDAARHDWIVLADSNVLIPPDYLDRLVARWTERCAFVCSPRSASTYEAGPSSKRRSSIPSRPAGSSPPTRSASASSRARPFCCGGVSSTARAAWQRSRAK